MIRSTALLTSAALVFAPLVQAAPHTAYGDYATNAFPQDAPNTGPFEDYDGDGRANIVEWALRGDPQQFADTPDIGKFYLQSSQRLHFKLTRRALAQANFKLQRFNPTTGQWEDLTQGTDYTFMAHSSPEADLEDIELDLGNGSGPVVMRLVVDEGGQDSDDDGIRDDFDPDDDNDGTPDPEDAYPLDPDRDSEIQIIDVQWWQSLPNTTGIDQNAVDTVYTVRLAPGGNPSFGYGTDTYTADTTFGFAGVHAGIFDAETGGTLQIRVAGSVASFTGSTQNGLTSYSWNSAYPGYEVLGGEPTPIDTDGDGILDVDDPDDDNDGTPDENDAFPKDENEQLDTDGDGTGNNADTDDDNDGEPDATDDFPLDPNEQLDTDGDGTGNNADTDDDGDGEPDATDAFPLDPTEQADTDGDGTGNHADPDDDNDGEPDTTDDFPLDPTEQFDSDGDGVGDNRDAFPHDPTETVDSDGDGIGDNADTDDDGDGIPDSSDPFPLINEGAVLARPFVWQYPRPFGVQVTDFATDGNHVIALGDSSWLGREVTNGLWQEEALGSTAQMNDIFSANGHFYAVGSTETLQSTDGAAWSTLNAPTDGNGDPYAWTTGGGDGNGTQMLAASDFSGFGIAAFTSDGGQNWVVEKGTNGPDGTGAATDVAYADGQWVILSQHSISFATPDGQGGYSWDNQSISGSPNLQRIFREGTEWVLYAGSYRYTYNGSSWTGTAGFDGDNLFVNLTDIAFDGTTYVGVDNNGHSYRSTDGTTWAKHVIHHDFSTIFWDGSRFVAGGNHGLIGTSPDGLGWTIHTRGGLMPVDYHAVFLRTQTGSIQAYDRSFAAGRSGLLHSISEDGAGSLTGSATSETILAGDYARPQQRDVYMMVGLNGTVTENNNAVDEFRQSDPGTTAHLRDVNWFDASYSRDDGFLVVGDNATLLRAQIVGGGEGFNWGTLDIAEATEDFYAVGTRESGNRHVVVVGSEGAIYTSNDLSRWFKRNSGTTELLRNALYIDGYADNWLVVGDHGTILTADANNTSTWISRSSGTTADLHACAHYYTSQTRDTYVAVGDEVALVSTDLATWTKIDLPGYYLRDVRFNSDPDGNYFIAVGLNGATLISPDGFSWQNIGPVGPEFSLLSVTAMGEQQVAVGGQHNHYGIITMAEGTQVYDLVDASPINTLDDVQNNGSYFIACGGSGIYHSFDGRNWTKVFSKPVNKVVWDGSRWIGVGGANATYASTDGTTWTTVVAAGNSYADDGPNGLIYGGGRFVQVNDPEPNELNNIRTSTDGTHWTSIAFMDERPVEIQLEGVAYNGSRYVAVANGNKAIYSDNGTDWTMVETDGALSYYWVDLISLGSKFVGISSAIDGSRYLATSTDGETWDYAPINARANSLYFDGQYLYLTTSESGVLRK